MNGKRVFAVACGLLGGLLIALLAGAANGTMSSFSGVVAHSELGLDSQAVYTWATVMRVILVVGSPLAGLLAAWIGAPVILGVGVLVASVSTAVLGFAQNAVMYGLSLAGVGLGFALLVPALLVFLYKTVRSRWWYATIAALYMGTALLGQFLSSLAAPSMIGNWVDEFSGVFVIAGLLALAGGVIGMGGAVLAYVLDRSSPQPEGEPARPAGSPGAWNLIPVGFAALFTGWAVSAQRIGSVQDMVRGLGHEQISFYLTAATLAVMLGYYVGGPLADLCDWLANRSTGRSWGRAAIAVLGALGLCLGAILCLAGQGKPLIGVALIVASVGYGLIGPSLVALSRAGLGSPWWGLGIGLYLGINNLAVLLSSLVSARLMDSQSIQGILVVALVAALLALLSALALLGLQFMRKRDAPASQPQAVVDEW